MNPFWSTLVHNLSPYVPGEQPKLHDLVKLNTNENPYPPSTRAVDEMCIRDRFKPECRLFARRRVENGGIVHEPLFETDTLPVLQVNRRNDQHFEK